MTNNWIAYYHPNHKPHQALYVSELPGHGGVDWGYTNDIKKALPISEYWWKRFASDRRACRSIAHCHPAPSTQAAE
jgi:hypothetical protein